MHGGDIYTRKIEYDFSVNINPFGCPSGVLEYVKKSLESAAYYPDTRQTRARNAIAALEGVDEDEIICGNGASELIMAVTRAVNPRNALIVSPGFYGYIHAIHSLDLCGKRKLESEDIQGKRKLESEDLLDKRKSEVSQDKQEFISSNILGTNNIQNFYQEYILREETGFLIQEDILDYIDPADMLFLTNPNNPTGRNIDTELLERILYWAKEKKCAVLLDECFLRLSDNGKSFKTLVKEYSNLYIVDAFTKLFALPGIRAGYLISSSTNLIKVKEQLPEWNLSTTSEALLEAGAKELLSTDYVDRSLEMIRTEREYLKDELSKLGLKVYASDTNFLLVRLLPDKGIDIYERLIQSKILIRDCSDFSGLRNGWYRIAVKRHEDNVELIKEIQLILSKG